MNKNILLLSISITFFITSFSQEIDDMNKKELKIFAKSQHNLIDSLILVLNKSKNENKELTSKVVKLNSKVSNLNSTYKKSKTNLENKISSLNNKVKESTAVKLDLIDVVYALTEPRAKYDLLTEERPDFMIGLYEGSWESDTELEEDSENMWLSGSAEKISGIGINITAVRGDKVYGYCSGFYKGDEKYQDHFGYTHSPSRLFIGKVTDIGYGTTCAIGYKVEFNIPGYQSTFSCIFVGYQDEEETNDGLNCYGSYTFGDIEQGVWIHGKEKRTLKLKRIE